MRAGMWGGWPFPSGITISIVGDLSFNSFYGVSILFCLFLLFCFYDRILMVPNRMRTVFGIVLFTSNIFGWALGTTVIPLITPITSLRMMGGWVIRYGLFTSRVGSE